MSVQQIVQLYQDQRGKGVVSEANPWDSAAFIVDQTSTLLTWGVLCTRKGLSNGIDAKSILELSGLDTIIGVTIKQLDRVDQETQGIVIDTATNASQSFILFPGKPASVLRMGYINMVAVGSWVEGNDVLSARIALESGSPFGIIGEISQTAAASQVTAANWDTVPANTLIFADSSDTGTGQIANVFVDLRFPVTLTA